MGGQIETMVHSTPRFAQRLGCKKVATESATMNGGPGGGQLHRAGEAPGSGKRSG